MLTYASTRWPEGHRLLLIKPKLMVSRECLGGLRDSATVDDTLQLKQLQSTAVAQPARMFHYRNTAHSLH